MAAASHHGPKEQAVLEKFIKAASYTTGCLGGLLLVCERARWSCVASHGEVPALAMDSSTDGWLKMLLSYGDVVDVSTIVPDAAAGPSNQLATVDGCLVCAAVRDAAGGLLGVVLLTLAQPHVRLSAAQMYGLQTHAADLRNTLESNKQATKGGHQVIERLRLLESVVVNAKDAILITEAEPIDSPGPRIVYCNPAFLAATGFSLEEVMGHTPRILHCEETSRATLDEIRHALERWKPVEVELINARRDGTRFWVQLSIVPVANEKGWFTHWVSVQRDVTERKEAEEALRQAQIDREKRVALESRLVERERIQEELAYAAFHDELTRLKNRAYFMGRIQASFVPQDEVQPGQATVLYLDLDRFKYINDGMGHQAGDKLLQLVAQRLSSCVPEDAVLARIGGDEFAILLTTEGHQTCAVGMAERIVQTLGLPIEIDRQTIYTSCSIGIVTLNGHHTKAEDLIRDADVAMYAAKKQGRGRWAIFDFSMRQASIDMLLMQNALKHAIARNEFYLVYQPIFSVDTGLIGGVEALVRWRHPVLGNVAPDVFISVAEDIGVIRELGRWVMRTACLEVKHWNQSIGCGPMKLNVNVSGVELNRPHYCAQVADMLLETGFPADALQIEITESVFLHEPETVAQTLVELRSLGIRIALDDFGTGYSSLGYIDRYPIDSIKIDRSFISRMMTHHRSVAIVQSILWLGRALDLAIVAEGVENQSQLQRLRELDCPFVQGYLLSPPLLAEDAKALLRDQPAARPEVTAAGLLQD